MISHRERDQRAVRLRASGLSHVQVASKCGYPSEDAAHKAVARFMARGDETARQEARGLYRERVETLLRSLWLAAVNPGMAQKAARENAQPEPPDQARAIELLCRLLDQLARVEGLYAAVRAEITGPGGGALVEDVRGIRA